MYIGFCAWPDARFESSAEARQREPKQQQGTSSNNDKDTVEKEIEADRRVLLCA